MERPRHEFPRHRTAVAKASARDRVTRGQLLRGAAAGLTAISLTPLLTACATPPPPTSGQAPSSPQASAETPRSGGTLKIISSPASSSPNLMSTVEVANGVQYTIAQPIFDALFLIDDEGNITPRLATPTVAEDGRSITLALRKGVKFHDGTDFDAESVQYHIKNMKYGAFRFSSIA